MKIVGEITGQKPVYTCLFPMLSVSFVLLCTLCTYVLGEMGFLWLESHKWAYGLQWIWPFPLRAAINYYCITLVSCLNSTPKTWSCYNQYFNWSNVCVICGRSHLKWSPHSTFPLSFMERLSIFHLVCFYGPQLLWFVSVSFQTQWAAFFQIKKKNHLNPL